MKRWPWTILLGVLLCAWSHPAVASTRLAVFIVADEAPLSNNLTEVAISRLAEKKGYELLGLRELEVQLNELSTVRSDGLRACLALSECLSEVGALAGVERIVIGDVRREENRFRLDLALVEVKTGKAEARLAREHPLELPELIAAVQAGVSELVPDASVDAAQPAPVVRVESPPPTQPVPRTPEKTRDEKSGNSIAPYVAYGTAALAVVAFSTAAVTGMLGTARPTGETRAEVQADLERRKSYASLANGLYVTGGILAGVSAIAFIVPWD